jgi:hypothetical protein
MAMRPVGLCIGLLALSFLSGEALAQSARKQCSEKYQAAKAAGTLNGVAWPQFLSQCVAEAKGEAPAASPTQAPAATPAPTMAAPAKPVAPKPAATTAATPAAPAMPIGNAVFPNAIAPAYANDKPGTARMKTCVDQYKANKTTNSNGGLRWIQKGGGYYSECNKHLKG